MQYDFYNAILRHAKRSVKAASDRESWYVIVNLSVIISRSSDRDARKAEIENELARLCAEKAGLEVLLVPHIYHLADGSKVWATIAKIPGPRAFVTWIHPRPTEALLSLHGLESKAFNLGLFPTAESCFSVVCDSISTSAGRVTELHEPVSERWYPVIDSLRCANCGHCVQFCLFDVYACSPEGKVSVTSPDNCKPGCPACSRICPEGAIIFPLYEKDAAVAGAPGNYMSPDGDALRMAEMRAKSRQPEKAPDDIDLLIDDLEKLTR